MKSSTTSLQNWNQSHTVCWSIWCSFWNVWDSTFCIMSRATSIISSEVSLLLASHQECLRLRVALHHSPCFPFPHLHRYLSMTLALLQRRMLLPHLGQTISLFNSPHSCNNFTPFSWSENKKTKKTFWSQNRQPPLHCTWRIPSGRKASSSFHPGKP